MSSILIQALRSTDRDSSEQDDSIHLLFDETAINLYLVGFIKIQNLATVKYRILRYIVTNFYNTGIDKIYTLNINLFETSCNQDCMRHVLSIVREVHMKGLLVRFNIVSEFDPELVELIGDDSVKEVIWGLGSYISFNELKETARKLNEGDVSTYGKIFIPKMVSKLRDSFNINLSDVASFNDIYVEDEILEILKPHIKEKSVIEK